MNPAFLALDDKKAPREVCCKLHWETTISNRYCVTTVTISHKQSKHCAQFRKRMHTHNQAGVNGIACDVKEMLIDNNYVR